MNSGNSTKTMHPNYTELNTARDIIPIYEGESRNLSYFLQQCENFINSYKIESAEPTSTHNEPLFEICCSKIRGTDRDVLVVANCTNWSQVREVLLNHFGDQRNKTLLENDLITCFQLTNETYHQYYERIKSKLQQLLEHVKLREADPNIIIYETNTYERALNTYQAGLLEPYRSFISHKSPVSLEDCLVHLRNHDNHKQQVHFLNFIRQKAHRMPQQPQNQQTFTQLNRTSFPTGPVNVFGKSAPNTQFGNANTPNKNQQLPKPTPMSVSTIRRAKPNSNFAQLHNVEELPNFDEFNDQSHEYEFESKSFDPQNSYYENETPEENFQLIASEEPPLT
ncbi:hypothetical protein Trydic_g18698 [Trypoxylus dichotomus]